MKLRHIARTKFFGGKRKFEESMASHWERSTSQPKKKVFTEWKADFASKFKMKTKKKSLQGVDFT